MQIKAFCLWAEIKKNDVFNSATPEAICSQ